MESQQMVGSQTEAALLLSAPKAAHWPCDIKKAAMSPSLKTRPANLKGTVSIYGTASPIIGSASQSSLEGR
jgi:hypothetical protein